MVEYRRDAFGRAMMMEINPRMGASVLLAVAGGVDLPGLVYASATGRPLWAIPDYRAGRRLRRISDDLRNLKSAFGAKANPESPSAGQAAATFLADFVRRPSFVDRTALRDAGPPLVELRKLFSDVRLGAARRLRPAHRRRCGSGAEMLLEPCDGRTARRVESVDVRVEVAAGQ
jgi:hypothetical protein